MLLAEVDDMRSSVLERVRSSGKSRGGKANCWRPARRAIALLLLIAASFGLARMTEFEEFGVSEQARACYLAQRVLATYEPRAFPLQVNVAGIGGGSLLGERIVGLPIDLEHAYRCYYLFPLTVYA